MLRRSSRNIKPANDIKDQSENLSMKIDLAETKGGATEADESDDEDEGWDDWDDDDDDEDPDKNSADEDGDYGSSKFNATSSPFDLSTEHGVVVARHTTKVLSKKRAKTSHSVASSPKRRKNSLSLLPTMPLNILFEVRI